MTARDRRALWVGGGILVVALAARLGAAGLRAQGARLEAARQAAELASRARTLVAEGPVRQALLRDRAREMVDLAPLLLAGASEVEAGAALAGELNALAARHRVAIARMETVPDSAAGGLTRIEVRLQAESDLAGLYGFVHAVESAPLLLSFTDLSITAQDEAAPMERLRLEGAVRGWMLRRAGGAAGAAETAGEHR